MTSCPSPCPRRSSDTDTDSDKFIFVTSDSDTDSDRNGYLNKNLGHAFGLGHGLRHACPLNSAELSDVSGRKFRPSKRKEFFILLGLLVWPSNIIMNKILSLEHHWIISYLNNFSWEQKFAKDNKKIYTNNLHVIMVARTVGPLFVRYGDVHGSTGSCPWSGSIKGFLLSHHFLNSWKNQ